jgi:release factor glutamine methyltransferase
MRIRVARDYFRKLLTGHVDEHEVDEIFYRVVEAITKQPRLSFMTDPTVRIHQAELDIIIEQLQAHKPIQYILGYEWFYEFRLLVNEHVLIPRPETAELVRWILDDLKQCGANGKSLLDIGTGSGCIPIVIKANHAELNTIAMDISADALSVAAENAKHHHLDIQFMQADILDPCLKMYQSFDIIVSNPPYITTDEAPHLDANVIRYEPHAALFVTNNDPLQFYKAIMDFADRYLKKGGGLYFEVHQDFAEDTFHLVQSRFSSAELRKDIYGAYRMIKAKM